jgi:DNA-binding MarR family transcriptional regulator
MFMLSAPETAMTCDVVRDLGYLTLGTRLKRLGESLQGQTQALLADAGIELPASHFPSLAALDRLGPLSVGELVEALGVSQPGVTRMIGNLEGEGLVRARPDETDKRVRKIELTREGRQLIARAKRLVWPNLEAAVADACAGMKLLAELGKLEDALAAATLSTRSQTLTKEVRRARA